MPIQRDHQRAGQSLVRVIEQNPQCVVVTKHVAREGTQANYVFFGASTSAPTQVPANIDLDRALDAAAPNSPCAIFYHGLDCNRTEAPCARETAEYPETWSERWRSEPYSDRDEYGEHTGELTVATYSIRAPEAE